jgi:DNA-binding ferritin-like protein
MSAENIHFLLTLRNQLKLYHWQTKSYARHKAVDKILGELDTHIDSFVEIYIGKYGRPKLTAAQATVKLHNLTDAGATNLCKLTVTYLQKQLVKGLTAADSDLINIRDEMMGEMHQLLYLFTLK